MASAIGAAAIEGCRTAMSNREWRSCNISTTVCFDRPNCITSASQCPNSRRSATEAGRSESGRRCRIVRAELLPPRLRLPRRHFPRRNNLRQE